MAETIQNEALVKKVLLHMYNSIVVGSINSIAILLRMKTVPVTMNPRHKDLKDLYDLLGQQGRRLFFNAMVSMVEFSLFNTLDFVEQYNRFDSETNNNEFPRVSLVYTDLVNGKEEQSIISCYSSQNLGQELKRTARREDIRQLIHTTITSILGSLPEDEKKEITSDSSGASI